MMRNQPCDAFDIQFSCRYIFEKFCNEQRTFLFLMLSAGISVFFPTQRAGNIMDNSCHLQRFLCFWIQSFGLADVLCKGPYLQKMINIMNISLIKICHFFNCSSNFHIVFPPPHPVVLPIISHVSHI